MVSNSNFIMIDNKRIINKKYIHEVYAIDNQSSMIVLCYPGMCNTEVKVYETIETIYLHLQ